MTTKLKVLSYNIHKGFTARNNKFVLANIKNAIQQVHADLVFLQEVVGANHKFSMRVAGWPDVSQFEFLADQVWPHFAYGRNAVYDAGNHGNAILSKLPIEQWDNFDISMNSVEQRGFLHAVIRLPGTQCRVHCVCVHLGLLKRWRQKQIDLILGRLEAEVGSDDALLVAGDFNDWSVKASKVLAQRFDLKEAFQEMYGAHPRTYPSRFPLLRLDRIYFRGITLHNAKVCVGLPWERLSDHAAIYGEFSVKEPLNRCT